jgi:hypothetical protein
MLSREQYVRYQIKHAPNKSSELWRWRAIPDGEIYQGTEGVRTAPGICRSWKWPNVSSMLALIVVFLTSVPLKAEELLFENVQVRSL